MYEVRNRLKYQPLYATVYLLRRNRTGVEASGDPESWQLLPPYNMFICSKGKRSASWARCFRARRSMNFLYLSGCVGKNCQHIESHFSCMNILSTFTWSPYSLLLRSWNTSCSFFYGFNDEQVLRLVLNVTLNHGRNNTTQALNHNGLRDPSPWDMFICLMRL